jgi:hypothetical protein
MTTNLAFWTLWDNRCNMELSGSSHRKIQGALLSFSVATDTEESAYICKRSRARTGSTAEAESQTYSAQLSREFGFADFSEWLESILT